MEAKIVLTHLAIGFVGVVYSSIISFGMYISLTPAEGSLPSVVPLVLPGQCLHDSSQVQCVVADIHPHC